MAAIKTQDGRVLLRDGRVSCECCDIDLINAFSFGPQGECDCETVACYDPITNPSPASLDVGGFVYENATPASSSFEIESAFLQAAIYQNLNPNTGNIVGWQNLVARPSVMQLTGSVGGDIRITQFLGPGSAGTFNGYQLPPDILSNFSALYQMDEIPGEGEFPCGICEQERNGPHNLNFIFTLFPNSYFRIQPVSFLECFPWYRLNLRRVSEFTPP